VLEFAIEYSAAIDVCKPKYSIQGGHQTNRVGGLSFGVGRDVGRVPCVLWAGFGLPRTRSP